MNKKVYHVPVMLNQCLEGLDVKQGGSYVDVTFGGGGHSTAIFNQLRNGKLFAFDQDDDAKVHADQLAQSASAERSFTFIASNFRYLKRYLKLHGADQVDGILADLGVSSHQIDEGSRGFSTRFDGDLDMRMDQHASLTAAHVVNTYQEHELIHLLSAYGEVKNARTLASLLVRERMEPIETSQRLKQLVLKLAPRGKENQYLAQVFQAIRIEVNQEMEVLKEFLNQTVEVLRPGGRLVIMSYHSLEDRLVKNFINAGSFSGVQEKDFYGNIIRPFDPVTRKPVTAEADEIIQNKRARSAKLRIAERNESVEIDNR